jgi:hypothetical protein
MESLPESFAEYPQQKLLRLCSEFNNGIRKHTTGTGSPTEFFGNLYEEFEKFREVITATRPKFILPQKASSKVSSPIVPHQGPNRVSRSIPEPPMSYPNTPASDVSRGSSDARPAEDSEGDLPLSKQN